MNVCARIDITSFNFTFFNYYFTYKNLRIFLWFLFFWVYKNFIYYTTKRTCSIFARFFFEQTDPSTHYCCVRPCNIWKWIWFTRNLGQQTLFIETVTTYGRRVHGKYHRKPKKKKTLTNSNDIFMNTNRWLKYY